MLLPEAADAQTPQRSRSLRIAHLCDVHVHGADRSAFWFEKALEHAQSQNPDLIIMGGDQIMDALASTREEMRAQWDLYRRVLRASISLPVEHVVGNHDVWGWMRPTQYKGEAGYGKSYALEYMGTARRYRSLDRGGWHIVILDSIFENRVGYKAKLDEDQFAWLQADLAQNRARATLIVSHAPILAGCPLFFGPNEASGNWRISGSWLHLDARRLKDLFAINTQVKACISGHIHLVDHMSYLGVQYYCNGAVSGAWWKGNHQEFAPGYALIDLFSNGLALRRYVPYGWAAA